MKKKYRKPLTETMMVDKWKCPWCRSVNEPNPLEDVVMAQGLFASGVVECPNCGKLSEVYISPTFIATPYEDF